MNIDLVVFDVAGTTVRDDDAVARFLGESVARRGARPTEDEIRAVMGLAKPVALRTLLARRSRPEPTAEEVRMVHRAFEDRMVHHYLTSQGVEPLGGAELAFMELRAAGVRVALDTGFSRRILNAILLRLGWFSPSSAFGLGCRSPTRHSSELRSAGWPDRFSPSSAFGLGCRSPTRPSSELRSAGWPDRFSPSSAFGLGCRSPTRHSSELRSAGWPDRFEGELLDATVTSDEVERGRPAPDMIQRAMEMTGVTDPLRVAKVGDTVADIREGIGAGCGLVIGVTSGTCDATTLRAEHPTMVLPNVSCVMAALQVTARLRSKHRRNAGRERAADVLAPPQELNDR